MALQQNVIDQVHTYTDFSGLNSLKAQARNDKNAALETVSKQFEAMFLNMVMKSMRDANKAFSEGNFMNSSQMEFYQQMFDSQLTQTLSKGNGIGIAKALLTQMSAQIEGVTQAADEPRHIDYGGIQSYAREMPAQAIQILEAVVEVDEMVKRDHPGSASSHDSVTGHESAEEQLDQGAAGVAGMDRLLSNPAVLADTNTRDREEEETEIDVDGIAENETETGEQVLESILPDQFESPEQFVEALYPIAKQIEAETGIDARFLLAQSALETGWGKHMIANQGETPSHNMFGIKADSRWQGDRIAITTTEYREGIPMKEKAYFRAYPSYDESFRDYARFLKGNERYQEALQWVDDPAAFARELQDAGYATDPAYSDKIQRIYNSDFVQSALLSSN